MAIHPTQLPEHHRTTSASQPIHGNSLEVRTVVRGITSEPLSIPLDERSTAPLTDGTNEPAPETPRRPLLRRDSLDRRNALLKGKEGSRRRQRWENDHLMCNPHVQPPLPSDFLPLPTYPQRHVPYYLAPLWDDHLARRPTSTKETSAAIDPALQIPQTLRQTLKKARAAKGLLQDLETEIRKFAESWERKQAALTADGFGDVLSKAGASSEKKSSEALWDSSSEDEEIVFVGRGGRMLDMPASPKATYKKKEGLVDVQVRHGEDEEEVAREKLVFESPAADRGASFGRYLVHSIATYYDLRTWSITVGDPARREAYVGIKLKSGASAGAQKRNGTGKELGAVGLPRPLWGMV